MRHGDAGFACRNAPPILFSSCGKENAPCTVEEKSRFYPNLHCAQVWGIRFSTVLLRNLFSPCAARAGCNGYPAPYPALIELQTSGCKQDTFYASFRCRASSQSPHPSLSPSAKAHSFRCSSFFPPQTLRWFAAGALLLFMNRAALSEAGSAEREAGSNSVLQPDMPRIANCGDAVL